MDTQPFVTATLGSSALQTAIHRYYRELESFKGKADYELAVRSPFQNLLADTARYVGWFFIPEQTLPNGLRPDGTVRDTYFIRGYWEAKGPDKDLEKQIDEKIKKGYPLTNIIFENTKRAVLYQNKKRYFECDMQNSHDLKYLLNEFFSHTEPDIVNFEAAVQEFKERIPELAQALLAIIEQEHKRNGNFKVAFESFAQLCRASLDPNIHRDTLNEMLIQHLLTERLFRTVFDNPDFVNRNVVACEIEKVILALTSHSFNRSEFLKSLDRFYVAIERAARRNGTWSERQSFLNTVYERFFQGFAVKKADAYGIVYTPQEIVKFMCASVEEVLKREFGTSLAEPGIQILDPATGTGNFIVNLMRLIPRSKLKYKYQHDLFCNEIMLLPYYIASLNIEHEYYEHMKEYEPFKGICFADTLGMAEEFHSDGKETFKQEILFLVEENIERVQNEKNAQIRVVIGNPPYNMGQKNENDNNKNRRYKVIDERIRKTYAKDSKATLNNKLYDAYVKFFRWAVDRLQEHDGIICFISNNSFINNIAFDGMRQHILQDFTHIYHLDLGGDARKRLGGNIFGITVGIGITILIRHREGIEKPYPPATVYYSKVADNLSGSEKLNFLSNSKKIINIKWQELQPDDHNTWLTEGMYPEFKTFLPIGTKDMKSTKEMDVEALFKRYSLGVATNRDEWVYDFDKSRLMEKMHLFIKNYNSEVYRWSQESIDLAPNLLQKDAILSYINNFVNNNTNFLKWTDRLKEALYKRQILKFESIKIRFALYRPFCKRVVYFDHLLNQRRYQQHLFFPTPTSEEENALIVVSDHGHRSPFSTFVTNVIPDLHLLASTDGFQCFSFYTYSEDGTNRRENITDWALQQFQDKYGQEITKWDIFHYVYGMLHHPQYRERYKENLKRNLPYIPLLNRYEAFEACVRIGKQLMSIHLNYEQSKEYSLEWIENQDVPFSWYVEKMHLIPDRTALVVNQSLTLCGIPQECFQYRLGNRSALEWVIDQYQVSIDKRSDIESNPNCIDDEEYIVRLVGKVITVSVETVKLVNELAQAVVMQDWLQNTVIHVCTTPTYEDLNNIEVTTLLSPAAVGYTNSSLP